ncbi:MAG: cytochrome and DOMON domain-containing protein [Methanomassiliicoccales archaeon]
MPSLVIDGTVSELEYSHQASFGDGDFVLHWTIDGDMINIAMVARTTGCVAIGFDPEAAMRNADMVVGFVNSTGGAEVDDHFSTGTFGPHVPDISLGGTNDLLQTNGSEIDGVTIIEFQRALDTGDAYDRPIPADGALKIIWSISGEDDHGVIHSQRGSGEIDFGSGESVEALELWPFHAVSMTVGTALLLMSVGTIYMKKRSKAWFKWHKRLGILGSTLVVIGLLIAMFMVDGVHLRVTHSYAGAFTIVLLVLPVFLGFAVPKVKNRKLMRTAHIWISRAAVLAVAITILLGLSLVI